MDSDDKQSDASGDADPPTHRIYEHLVAVYAELELGGVGVSVTANAQVRGVVSGRLRQVDALVSAPGVTGSEALLVVEARREGRNIEIGAVDGFLGKLEDCDARRGVIVAEGFSEGAEARADERVELTLLTYDEAETMADDSVVERCRASCPARTGGRWPGVVLFDQLSTPALGGAWMMVWTGKCDRCWTFHVWCTGCGERFVVPDGAEHRCGCEFLWSVTGTSGGPSRPVLPLFAHSSGDVHFGVAVEWHRPKGVRLLLSDATEELEMGYRPGDRPSR